MPPPVTARQVLHRGAIAIEQDQPVGLVDAIGKVAQKQRGILKLQTPVDLRLGQRAAHRHVHYRCPGSQQVGIENLQNGQTDAALHAEIPWILGIESQAARHAQSSVGGDEIGAPDIDALQGSFQPDGLGILQYQILKLQASQRLRVRTGIQLHGGKSHIRLHLIQPVERAADGHFALQEAVERQILAQMLPRSQVMQRGKRDMRNLEMRLPGIIAFHAPLAAAAQAECRRS